MYIDKDSRGLYSICDLREDELRAIDGAIGNACLTDRRMLYRLTIAIQKEITESHA